MPKYRLVMRAGPSVGKVFPLDKPELTVGRDLNNDIVINDPEISRQHARFYQQGNTYCLEDNGSTNGSFIKGQRLSGPYMLPAGVTITFGERITLVYELDEVPQDSTVISRPNQPQENPVYQDLVPPPPPSAYPAQPQPVFQSRPPVYPTQPLQPVQPQLGPDSYSGQVPFQAPPPKPVRNTTRMILILAVVLLLLVCVCVGIGLWVAPTSFWCTFPVWPEGSCP